MSTCSSDAELEVGTADGFWASLGKEAQALGTVTGSSVLLWGWGERKAVRPAWLLWLFMPVCSALRRHGMQWSTRGSAQLQHGHPRSQACAGGRQGVRGERGWVPFHLQSPRGAVDKFPCTRVCAQVLLIHLPNGIRGGWKDLSPLPLPQPCLLELKKRLDLGGEKCPGKKLKRATSVREVIPLIKRLLLRHKDPCSVPRTYFKFSKRKPGMVASSCNASTKDAEASQ